MESSGVIPVRLAVQDWKPPGFDTTLEKWGATVSDKDTCRRWTIAISQLKSRAAKVRRGGAPQETADLVEQSLSLCDGIVRDLAGAGLQLDESRVKLDSQIALWTHLFDEMPTACVETDASGVILGANHAAAVLFNTSVKHLTARLLMHFAEDRDQFGQLLRGLSAESVRHRCALIIRPRERAPVRMDATVVVRSPGDMSSWLWFFLPLEHHETAARRHTRTPVETVQQTAGLPT
jgi:PAS domain-containing protein